MQLVSLSVDEWTLVTADKSTLICGVVFAQWTVHLGCRWHLLDSAHFSK